MRPSRAVESPVRSCGGSASHSLPSSVRSSPLAVAVVVDRRARACARARPARRRSSGSRRPRALVGGRRLRPRARGLVTSAAGGGARRVRASRRRTAFPVRRRCSGLIVVAAATFRLLLVRAATEPRVLGDELVYTGLAKSFALDGQPRFRGELDLATQPAVSAPPQPRLRAYRRRRTGIRRRRRRSTRSSFTSAAVPAYLLARRVAGAGLALAVAALVAFEPWTAYGVARDDRVAVPTGIHDVRPPASHGCSSVPLRGRQLAVLVCARGVDRQSVLRRTSSSPRSSIAIGDQRRSGAADRAGAVAAYRVPARHARGGDPVGTTLALGAGRGHAGRRGRRCRHLALIPWRS